MISLIRRNKILILWILYVGAFLFFPWWNRVYFLWDDLVFLMRFRDTTLSSFFEHHGYQLHPIFSWFYWLQLQVFGVNASAFLFVAVIIHIVNILLVHRTLLVFTASRFYAMVGSLLVAFNKSYFTVIYWPTIHSHLLLTTELLIVTLVFFSTLHFSTRRLFLLSVLLLAAGFTQGFGIAAGVITFGILLRNARHRWKMFSPLLLSSLVPVVTTIAVSGRDVSADRIVDSSLRQLLQLILFVVGGVTQNTITRFFLPGILLNRFHPWTLAGMIAIPLAIGLLLAWRLYRTLRYRSRSRRTNVLLFSALWTSAPFLVAGIARSKTGILGSLAERYAYVPFFFFILWILLSLFETERQHPHRRMLIRTLVLTSALMISFGHQLTLYVAVKELFL